MKKVLTVLRNDLSAITPKYDRHDSNMLYVSYPKGATDQFVIYHFYFLFIEQQRNRTFYGVNQFFYRESPLPIGSPALNIKIKLKKIIYLFQYYNFNYLIINSKYLCIYIWYIKFIFRTESTWT